MLEKKNIQIQSINITFIMNFPYKNPSVILQGSLQQNQPFATIKLHKMLMI